jgi:hypothetical protein
MEKNQIELIANQTNNLEALSALADINSEDKERYDFLFETSKAENPGVCTYIIHMACVEQIAIEKDELPTEEQIQEVAQKYKSKPGRDELYENLISFKSFDDE